MKTAIHKHAVAGLAAAALALPMVAQTLPAPPKAASPAVATSTCSNKQISIYFPAYESELTPQSERLIDAISDELKDCYVAGVAVNVLSEEAHTDEDAASLSEARASNVMTALLDNGIEPASYKADYDRVEAAAPGAQPMVEPMARRVSVAFEVRPGYGV